MSCSFIIYINWSFVCDLSKFDKINVLCIKSDYIIIIFRSSTKGIELCKQITWDYHPLAIRISHPYFIGARARIKFRYLYANSASAFLERNLSILNTDPGGWSISHNQTLMSPFCFLIILLNLQNNSSYFCVKRFP